VTAPTPPRTQDAVIFNEPGRRTIPRGDGGDSCAARFRERTPAHEAALHITALVSGTGQQGGRPDAQPASIVALAVPSCPPRTQRTFPGVPSSNLATFAPAVSDSSADFFSVAPAAFHRAAFDARHGFFVEQPCDCASSGLATAKRRGKCHAQNFLFSRSLSLVPTAAKGDNWRQIASDKRRHIAASSLPLFVAFCRSGFAPIFPQRFR